MPARYPALPARTAVVTAPATPRPVRIPGELSETNFSAVVKIVLIVIVPQFLRKNFLDFDIGVDPFGSDSGDEQHSAEDYDEPHPFRHDAIPPSLSSPIGCNRTTTCHCRP